MTRPEDKFVAQIKRKLAGIAVVNKIHGDEYHIGIPDLAITGKHFLWLEAKVGAGDPWERLRDSQKGFFKRMLLVNGPAIIVSQLANRVFVSAGGPDKFHILGEWEFYYQLTETLKHGFHSDHVWLELRE